MRGRMKRWASRSERMSPRPNKPIVTGSSAVAVVASETDTYLENEPVVDSDLDSTAEPPPRVGQFTLSGKETSLSFYCNAMAYDGDRDSVGPFYKPLMVLSAAGSATSIKALNAFLQVKTKTCIKPSGIPDMGSYLDLDRFKEGYTIHRSRMAYNTWHLLAIAKRDGLLFNASEESLWLALRDQRITTPVVRWWVPWLAKTFRQSGHIRSLRCFGCDVAMFTADTDAVDKVVTEGIQSGELSFKKPKAAA